MSKNQAEIPFTELVERASELARERVDVRGKIRGIVNDFYVREIPRKADWNFLMAQSTVTTVAEYTVGSVTANTGATTLTFSSDVVITSAMVGRLVKISGNDYLYRINAMSGTTGATIVPPISGDQNVSSATYSIFQPFYPLAADFDRFPKNGGLVNYQGSAEEIIPEKAYQDWALDYSATPVENPTKCRLYGYDTAGSTLLEMNPPPKIDKSFRYDYFLRLSPMRETTAGFVNVSAAGTTVTGSAGTTRFTEATTGDYFRVDALGKSGDSEWYRIIAITNNSSLTLQTAFGLSGVTSANYTICRAPYIPYKLHPAILYGSLLQLVADQDDPMYVAYNMKLAEVLSDGKRLYTSRIYSQDIHHLGEEYRYRY